MIAIKTNKINSDFKKYIDNTKIELLVIGVFFNDMPDFGFLDSSNKTILKDAIKTDSFKGEKGEALSVYGKNGIKRVLLYGLGSKKKNNAESLRVSGANIYKYANLKKIKSLSLYLNSFKLKKDGSFQSILEGIYLGSYFFDSHQEPKNKKEKITQKIDLITEGFSSSNAKKSIDTAQALIKGVSLARDLGNEPANICTPTYIANSATEISKAKNMKAKIFDVKEFEKMNLGSFYGVARGAKEPAKFIIVEYSGGKKGDPAIALIGKGLTFDTGGISLKPSPKMDEMKFDMCGSATVMGVMKAVSILQPKINIVFAIGSTENMPGGDAQRPGDIVTAHNGKTIEVLNTDAEGRLVLADVLSYINKNYKPKTMIDFATLTGAVIVALGHRATGLMGNNSNLISSIKKSSKETGEKVWELPLWDEYTDDIKSKYADIKNIGSGGAGTITAGAFLKEFVGDTPWCHLDIAGTAWGVKASGYNPDFGATGVAVRLIYDFIEKEIK